MKFKIYLSGEIHSSWGNDLKEEIQRSGLEIEVLTPNVFHEASDEVGVNILGPETNHFWKDHKGALINSIRSKTFIEKSDVVIVKFGDKYRQWNAAFEAGFASALGKSIITLHDESLDHALKEVDAAAAAVCHNPKQVVEILRYILT